MSELMAVGNTAARNTGRDASQRAVPFADEPRAVAVANQSSATELPVAAQPLLAGKALVAALGVYSLLAGLLFYDTLASMVTIWLRSQTFAHGFLILPISLWLAWRLRDRIDAANVRPEPRALLLLLAAGLVWLSARLVDVQVVQQLAFVALLVSGIWVIAGTHLARRYAFPLGFLFLAVPMGAGLIPPLMEFTADTTEYLLRVSGIPVYREGMYLNLPSGTWSVIEECSGVRYLIASFTLGLLYAYLTYASFWRRAAFVAAAIAVPILANSARAYGLVMVGHLSDTRIGVGDDHLVYGWVFFGLVMLLMFWIGGIWQQPVAASDPGLAGATSPRSRPALSLLAATVLALLFTSAWPAITLSMDRNNALAATTALTMPAAMGNWQAVNTDNWRWLPDQTGADRELDQRYTSAGPEPLSVSLHLRQYLQQRQGVELVSSTEPWRPDRRRWRVIGQEQVQVDLGHPITVDEVRVVSPRHDLLVWSWYRVGGRNTAHPVMAKLLEAKQQLVAGRRQGSRLFLSTPVGEDIAQARSTLQAFVAVYHSAIETALDEEITASAGSAPGGAG